MPFYVYARFRVASDYDTGLGGWDSGCRLLFGLIDGGSGPVVGVGARDENSSGFFGGVGGDASGTDSTVGIAGTVAVDQDVFHDAEVFATGDGKIWAAIDRGTPIEITSIVSGDLHNGMPVILVSGNGDVCPAIGVNHFAIAAASNLPTTG